MDDYGHENEENIIQISVVVSLAVMTGKPTPYLTGKSVAHNYACNSHHSFTDKVDGVLLRDHVLPLAKKLCNVANKSICIHAKHSYVQRITDAIGHHQFLPTVN